MSATGTLRQDTAMPGALDQPIIETAFVGANPSSFPTAQARRRSFPRTPQPVEADKRRRAASSVAKTAVAVEDGISTFEFWASAIVLNLAFWLWALYGV